MSTGPEAGVWVRGYGLVDSPKIKATPGKLVNLKAVVAPNPRAAAEYCPANYRLSSTHRQVGRAPRRTNAR